MPLPLAPGDGADFWTEWTAHSPLQAWVKDLHSRFVAVSPAFARWCGVQPGDMSGRTEACFFPVERIRQFRIDDLRVVALDRPFVVEERGPSGRYATLKRPIRDGRGRVCGTIGIAYEWPADRLEPPISLPEVHRPVPQWLQNVTEVVELEFRSPMRVREVAKAVGRHPNHVSRAFRQYFGLTAVEWVHRLRVAWVAESLLSGDHPLSALSQRAGFADQAHMTRIFKRYYGLTPGQYRRASSFAD